jgi:hypothetical protein
MRKLFTLMALVALAACDSATGSDRGAREAPGGGEARAPEAPSLSGGSGHRAAIPSVRRRAFSSGSGLYAARAVATDGGEVTLEIRSSTSAGFSALTSGTLEETDTGTGEVDHDFAVTAGTRYLIIAYPSSGGGATLDATHASFIEIDP